MPTPQEILLLGFETHSTEKIQEALAAGLDVNGLLEGKTPLTLLVEMYLRSPKFSDCVRCLMQAGARCSDVGLLAVLLDDAELLEVELRKNPSLIHHQVDIHCAFTPLFGASLLHVAAEFGLVRAAAVLLKAGADVEAKAAVDDYGFNGHTPIFHTVCQNRNHCQSVLRLVLEHGAKADIRLAGITWGKVLIGRRRSLMLHRYRMRKRDCCRSSNVTSATCMRTSSCSPKHRVEPFLRS